MLAILKVELSASRRGAAVVPFLFDRREGRLAVSLSIYMTSDAPSSAEVQRFRERLGVLSNATRAFARGNHSSSALFDAVVAEVAETLHCACILNLLSDDGEHFKTSHLHAAEPAFLRACRQHFESDGPNEIRRYGGVEHVVRTRTPFFFPDVAVEEFMARAGAGLGPFIVEAEVKSMLVVPLILADRVVGTLGLFRRGSAPALDEYDLAVAQCLAEHASLALTTARSFEIAQRELAERERMAARLNVLSQAARDFSEATGDYQRLLSVIARRVADVIGDLCVIRPLSADRRQLEAGAVHHADPRVVAWAEELLLAEPQPVGEGTNGRVAASGEPLFIPRITTADYAATTSPRYRAILERLQVGSVIVVPLICRDEVVGVASLLRSGAERPYDQSDLALFKSIADHAALALTNARSYAAELVAHEALLRANEALRQSEEAQRLLFEESPVPLFVFDVETLRPLAVNAAALSHYGYSREEFMQLRLSSLAVDGHEASERRLAAWGDLDATGTGRYFRKDGSQYVGEFTARPLRFAGRRARITVVKDVTDRHEAEQTRALLAAIVQSSNDAIVSKQLDGTITSWNHAAERLFGYSSAEAVGQPITLVIPADRFDEERSLLARITAGERIDHYETIRLKKDGSPVAVSISLAPIKDASGRVTGASKTGRDLSQQRKSEEALRRSEMQLRQAQKMEAVGRLAGGIAHDFNNILSVILSCSDMLLGDLKPGDPVRADIDEINKAAVRAAELTRQLLVFSHQQVIEPRVFDLNAVVKGLHKMLERILGEDIHLVSVPAAKLGRVQADPSNVEQVIMNLVVNARDAMPTGGRLTIETGNVELDEDYAREHIGSSPGPHVMLAISDTGIGMDAATQARIFEPFFTTKATGKGTGLGLSTVFGIAQRSGGSVWVYSEPGRGTTFKVYFPRVDREVDVEPMSLAPGTLRGTETILLVEDQEQVRSVALNILKRSGYHVIVAQSAGEALLLCEKHPQDIQLLLTDVVMPQLSGAELAKRVASSRPHMKVLCMSGYTDDSVVRHGVIESALAFLQKPFTPESLTRKIREVLNSR